MILGRLGRTLSNHLKRLIALMALAAGPPQMRRRCVVGKPPQRPTGSRFRGRRYPRNPGQPKRPFPQADRGAISGKTALAQAAPPCPRAGCTHAGAQSQQGPIRTGRNSAAQRHFRRCRGVQQGGIQQGNIRMFRLHQQADLCTAEHNPLCAPGLKVLDNR